MANMCLLDDALHRDFGYMNCWAQNILMGLAGGNSYRALSDTEFVGHQNLDICAPQIWEYLAQHRPTQPSE